MAFKFIAFVAFIGAATASVATLPLIPIEDSTLARTVEEHNSFPQYTYTYGVTDAVSGDSKSQTETRNGDIVHGEYSLNDADGYRRTVKYTADDVNGFNAVVDRRPIIEAKSVAVTPIVVKSAAPIVAPVTYTAPTLIKSAPIAYAAPSLIKSIPAIYTTRSVFKPTVTYAAEPTVYRSLPLVYSAPGLVGSDHFTYTGPAAYTAQTIKSLPRAYQTW